MNSPLKIVPYYRTCHSHFWNIASPETACQPRSLAKGEEQREGQRVALRPALVHSPVLGFRAAERTVGMDDADAGPSVKSIGRAATILKILAALPAGAGLTEIARGAGFGKATTHRILAALADVGFAYQNGATRQYHLGVGLANLSRQALRRDVEILAEPVMLQLAQQTEDTIYVLIQEGLRSVCIGRQQGSFPIKTLTLDVGQSRPLGVGSGSLALLAFLPPGEIDAAIQANMRWLAEFPSFGPDAVRAYVRETQERGYAFVKGYMTPGINAIGVPVFDAQRRPLAALSLTAIADRVTGDRALWLASLLREEAERLSKLILARSRSARLVLETLD